MPPKPYAPPKPASLEPPKPKAEAAPVATKVKTEDPSEIFGDGLPFGDPNWYQRWHTPYYNESHRRLRAEVREWVTKEIEPNCFEWVLPI